MIALTLGATLLVTLLGYWIARVGLRPLKQLSNEAQALGARTLSQRLRGIVNNMLFLARADRGEAATCLVQAPVAQEIGKTIEFLEFILDKSQETVAVEGDITAVALIETGLFRHAVANLLQNAIEHSPARAEIRVSIRQSATLIRIAVSNPGAPIAPAHLPLLFDRFYRVDAARHNAVVHGHGLGLAIVKAIATMHGGDVFAASNDGITTIGFSVSRAGAV